MAKLTVALAALVALSFAGTRAQAQTEQLAQNTPAAQPASLDQAPSGPSLQAAELSPRFSTDAAPTTNSMRVPSRGSGVGLMILGGAALLTGAIIGDTPGTIIAVGGAVVGLYGLYVYLDRPHGMEQRSGNGIGLGYSLKTN
jgi:hypothetical protein